METNSFQSAIDHAETGVNQLEESTHELVNRTQNLEDIAHAMMTEGHDHATAAVEGQRHLTETVAQGEPHIRDTIESNISRLHALIARCVQVEQTVRTQTASATAAITQATETFKNVERQLEEEAGKTQKLVDSLATAIDHLQSEQGRRQTIVTQHLAKMMAFAQTASSHWESEMGNLMTRWDSLDTRLHTSIDDLDQLSKNLSDQWVQKNGLLITTLGQHTETGMHALDTVLVDATRTSLLAYTHTLTQELTTLDQAGTRHGQEVHNGLDGLTSTLEGIFPFLNAIQGLTGWIGELS